MSPVWTIIERRSMVRRFLPPNLRARGVTAVLGPTNTGKTHLAIERMLGHDSGMIGLPLRLLAREVYNRVVERAGAHNVALITGEEKIKPDRPRYWISTVEAMPRDLDLAFVAVDEIQLAADLDRGHVFTDRLLHQRGREETILIGSSTMRPLIEALLPNVHVTSRPRLSHLSFAGSKKVSRLPPRSAIVAFSAEEVYAIAEVIRRQRGGAAVVLGALSPRTRNAQVELYQAGDVDYLVATDAIGMGLNLDVNHVAFASDMKFDGFHFRKLFPAELGQIAGRAGRYLRDGTFGTTGRCPDFDAATVDALENHLFDTVQVLQWRNSDLDFSSIASLQSGLMEVPRERGLTRAPLGEDLLVLESLAREDEIVQRAKGRKAIERLWETCQLPDYRKISANAHADLAGTLYRFLMDQGQIPTDWFQKHISALDRTDGDIDTLSNRIAQVRTWNFVANRPDWLSDPEHWQGGARQVEDRLSDALHDRLAQRFVDRRTSVLLRRLRENRMLEAEITPAGDVVVEGQHIGLLNGFQFIPDTFGDAAEGKTLRNAAQQALAGEIDSRAERFSGTADSNLVLANDGAIRWMGDPVARLERGDSLLAPGCRLIADDLLSGGAREKVEERLRAWLKAHVVRLLGPLLQLEEPQELTGIARGIAFQLFESLGVLERAKVLQEVRGLEQEERASLRRLGVRFGAYHLYLPLLLKPAPRLLATQLWALVHGGLEQKGLGEIAHLANSGRTSIPVEPEIAQGLYAAAGFRVCGTRAVRVDILERLADLIRPAIAYRPGVTAGEPPAGAADGDGFVATVAMTSLVGCAGEDFAAILTSLGYSAETRPGLAITVPLLPAAPQTPVQAGGREVVAADIDAVVVDGPEEPAADVVSTEGGLVEDGAGAPEPALSFLPETVQPQGEPVALPSSELLIEAELSAVAGESPVADSVPPVDAEEPSNEAEAVEPETVQIWRQRRHQHHHRGSQRHGRPPQDGKREDRFRGPRREERGQGGSRPGEHGSGDRAQTLQQPYPQSRVRGEGDAAREGKPLDRGARPDRPKRDSSVAGGPGGERIKGGDRGSKPRDDRRPGKGDFSRSAERGKGRPFMFSTQSESPRKAEDRRPDPDSPFAKLLALKEQMQRGDGEKK